MTLYTLSRVAATAATALAAVTSTTASNTFSLFVMEPTQAFTTPTIRASIISAEPSLTRTTFWINCDDGAGLNKRFGQPELAPCNHIDGASVTVDPTAMTINLRRQSQVVDARMPTDGSSFVGTKETMINVTATATCTISGTATASCTGHMTSSPVWYTYKGTSTWGLQSTVQIETISTAFANVAAHSAAVTITAGFDNVPTTTIRATSSTRSKNGVARATGQAHLAQAVLVGVAALAGGVALI